METYTSHSQIYLASVPLLGRGEAIFLTDVWLLSNLSSFTILVSSFFLWWTRPWLTAALLNLGEETQVWIKAGIKFLRGALPLPPRQLVRNGLTLQETEGQAYGTRLDKHIWPVSELVLSHLKTEMVTWQIKPNRKASNYVIYAALEN